MNARSRIGFLALALIAIAAAGAGASLWWRGAHRAQAAELATGTMLAPARALPDFSLIDARGRSFGNAQLRGRWSLMFFGYTNCPDFCPATLTTLAAMEQHMRAAHAPAVPQVVFVSVDAKRDTPAQLAKYVPYFDPGFIGLTAADQPSIEALARKLGVAVVIQPRPDGGYTVDHSGAIFVLDPRGRLAAILTGPFTPDDVQHDFERIVAAQA
jgi:protein SCO1